MSETEVGLGKGAAYTQHRFIALKVNTTKETIYDIINDLHFARSPEQIQFWGTATFQVEFDKDASGSPLYLANTVYVYYMRFTNLHVVFPSSPPPPPNIFNILAFWD